MSAATAVWRCGRRLLLPLLILVSGSVSRAELVFLSGPLANATYTVVPASRYLGPQASDSVTVTGVLVAIPFIDACAPGDIRQLSAGNVLVINEGACSPERQYDELVAQGPAAIIALTLWRPGGTFANIHDGVSRAASARSTVPYLQLTFRSELVAAFVPGPEPVLVRVRPDPNPWLGLYESPPYQAVMRWGAALGYLVASLLAWTYLGQHLALVLDRYDPGTSSAAGGRHRIAYVVRHLSALHLALALQGVQCGAVAVVRALGGYFSDGRAVAGPTQRFFTQDLSGYSLVGLQIASTFWNRIRLRALSRDDPGARHPHRALMVRLLTGELRLAAAFWYAVVLANELATATIQATYTANLLAQPALILIQVVVVLGIVFIGTQFVISVVRFWGAVRGTSAATDRYVGRLSRRVVVLGLALLVQVVVRLLAVDPDFLQPMPFFALFTAATAAQIVVCILIASVLKPRSKAAVGAAQRAPLNVVVGSGGESAATGVRSSGSPTKITLVKARTKQAPSEGVAHLDSASAVISDARSAGASKEDGGA